MAMTMFIGSLKFTPMAALSRAICGIRGSTLIINFPGSKKAVVECFTAVQEIILHALQLITDQKDVTNTKHQQMQENFNFQHKAVVHEESFDSQSVISSTSGIASVSDSNESLFRRVESINERTNKLRQIKNQGSPNQRMDFVDVSYHEQDFLRNITKSPNNQQYVAKTSLIEVDNRSEIDFTSDFLMDPRPPLQLTTLRPQSRFDSSSSSSCSISSAPLTVMKNEKISEISKLDDMFSKSSEPMQEVIFAIFHLNF